MRLDHLELRHYAPLEFSGITSVDADFPVDINVIIGTNGSGKTSLMNTMSPVSLSRPMFEKSGSKSHGYRKQIWSHQGHAYTLISDYSKPSSPHEFYVDDNEDNLNVGGTSQLQQDLYQTYMGMSPIMLSLITNSLKFSELSATARKAILMEINPSKIGFVFDLQKRTASKLKAVKANLARLQDRKLQLEQQLLSDFEITQIKSEVLRLEKITADLTKYQHTVDYGLSSLPRIQTPLGGINKDYHKVAMLLDHEIYRCHDVPRDDEERLTLKQSLEQQSHTLQGTITALTETLTAQAAELQIKQQQLESISDDEERLRIERDIALTEIAIKEIIDRVPAQLWTKDQLRFMRRQEELISNVILFFLYNHTPIMPTPVYRRKTEAYERWTMLRQRLVRRMDDAEQELNTLRVRVKLKPSDLPDLPCEQYQCVLRASFMASFSSLEEQMMKQTRIYDQSKRKLERLTLWCEKQLQQINDQGPIREQLRELTKLSQEHPILHRILRSENILALLTDTPKRISDQITQELVDLEMYYRKIDLQETLRQLYTDLSRFTAAGDGSRDKLVTYIQNEEKRLHDLSERIADYSQKISAMSAQLGRIAWYEKIHRQLMELQAELQNEREGHFLQHEYTQLTDLRITIGRVRSETLTRLGEISHTLRDQELLKARYTEEVVGEINRLMREQEILTKTEQGLQEIPKRYIIPFNNLIIEQMNLFLESVWTQDIVLTPFTSDADLKTYNFPFEKYGKPLADISMASEGEQEFLNLIFALSVRIVLNMRDYPLFLDETGRTFDERHKSNLIEMLRSLINEQIVSQLFLINHHAVIHEGFSDADVIVLKEDNIVTPEVFNRNFVMM